MTTAEPAVETDSDGTNGTPVRLSPIVVQTLNRNLVRAYLQAEDYRFWTDQAGDFLVEFRYSDRVGGALTMGVHLEGSSEDILSISVECDRRFIPERRADLLELINTYHREYRWPKVSLWDDDGALRIDCETQVDLSSGVHERLLHELIDSAFAEGDSFWRWLTRRIRTGTTSSAADDADEPDGDGDEAVPSDDDDSLAGAVPGSDQ